MFGLREGTVVSVLWAVIASIAVVAIVWRITKTIDTVASRRYATPDELAVALLERRNAAQLAALTLEARAAVENAELENEARQIEADKSFAAELRGLRRQAAEAGLQAKVTLANEFARDRQSREADREDWRLLVELYAAYIQAMSPRPIRSFPDFVKALRGEDITE